MALAVLSPHPDDAVCSCWHVLDDDEDVQVVNVFAAVPEPGTPLSRWDRITGATAPSERARERLREDERALATAGRAAIALPFLDSQYRDGAPDEEAVASAIEALPAERLYAPAGLGGHSDHRLVRDVALRLDRPVSFYGDLPYATEFGWPAWVTGAEADPHLDVDASWRHDAEPLVGAGFAPRAVLLSSDQQRRKEAALRLYRTQFAALEAGVQRRLTHPGLIRWELVWERREIGA